jgi:hypothetical protein
LAIEFGASLPEEGDWLGTKVNLYRCLFIIVSLKLFKLVAKQSLETKKTTVCG